MDIRITHSYGKWRNDTKFVDTRTELEEPDCCDAEAYPSGCGRLVVRAGIAMLHS